MDVLSKNKFSKRGLKTSSYAGLFGFALSFTPYWRASFVRRKLRGGLLASTHKLSVGDERKAPRQSLSAPFCIGFNKSRYDCHADP